MIQRILYNVSSQTLRHVPPERVTSATYVIEDLWLDEGSRSIASGSATVDSTATTTDAAAGPSEANPYRVPVTATTGFAVGDNALIASADGSTWERFVVDGLSAGDYLVSDVPLVNDYASGANVYGIDVSASFPDATAADESYVDSDRPFRVIWTYTIRGKTHRAQDQIRLVRSMSNDADSAAVVQLIRETYPDIIGRLPTAATIDKMASAAVSFVNNSLRRKGINPLKFHGGDLMRDAVYWRTLHLCASNGSSPGARDVTEFMDETERQYNRIYNDLTTGQAGEETLDLGTQDGAIGNRSRKYRSPFLGA